MRVILFIILTFAAPSLVYCDSISSHIINGTLATTNQFPYQAAISVKTFDGNVTRCSGALIDARWVLTVASCFNSALSVTVRLGSNNFSTGGQFWDLLIGNVKIHPHFNQFAMVNETTNINMHNNIALIRLNSTAVLSTSVAVIKILPKASSCGTTLRNFIIAGWGLTWESTAAGKISEQLRQTSLTEITNAACRVVYNHLDPNQICVKGATTQSWCKGDDGSPLVLTKQLVALASWGKPNCITKIPTVTQLVTPYIDWIQLNTGLTAL